AGWRATYSVPTVPPAPGRFSTITLAPSLPPRPSATLRAIRSVEPPAAKGTTMRITLSDGQAACAPCAAMASMPARAHPQRRRNLRAVILLPLVLVELPVRRAPGPAARSLQQRDHARGRPAGAADSAAYSDIIHIYVGERP